MLPSRLHFGVVSCVNLTMYVVLIENLTGSIYTAGLSCIDFVWSMTYSRTICSLYTQALKGALGKHILILIPFYSILFHVSTRVWKKKSVVFFWKILVLSLFSAVHETCVSKDYAIKCNNY